MNVILLAHFFRDDFPEMKRRPAGSVFLEPMMSLDDFNVDAGSIVTQDSRRIPNKFHHDVHRGAHAGSHHDRRALSGFRHAFTLIIRESRRRDDERYFAFLTHIQNAINRFRE